MGLAGVEVHSKDAIDLIFDFVGDLHDLDVLSVDFIRFSETCDVLTFYPVAAGQSDKKFAQNNAVPLVHYEKVALTDGIHHQVLDIEDFEVQVDLLTFQ